MSETFVVLNRLKALKILHEILVYRQNKKIIQVLE